MPVASELKSSGSPVKLWVAESEVEEQARQQLLNLAALPFVFKHVAAMPDVHVGIGATVGSVFASKGALIPAAVGVDIGCGMMAVQLNRKAGELADHAREIRSDIEARVPVGFNSHKEIFKESRAWTGWKNFGDLSWNDKDLKDKAMKQLGTLGGGNHFIEVCADQNGDAWLMLHSGSRNIGKTLAERHMREAKSLAREAGVRLRDMDLAWFDEKQEQFGHYVNDLNWCQQYALQNRQTMMANILSGLGKIIEGLAAKLEVNCHHNYAVREIHFGEKVWVTRKGAVRAGKGEWGIIPGSMGARSFIVRGLGAEDSFQSCSHGAGRRMSRTEAKKRFNLRDLQEQTIGVESRKDHGVLDEIPGAYKDIDVVMAQQTDLVESVFQLKQFICVKG
jgi:tRNA-splicing ligase RtcB